jgi:hypothetical protein
MKILCVSDHPDPVVYSENIKKRFADVGLVVACGDLPLSYYDFIASNLNKPLLFVFGNHNLTMLDHFEKHINLTAPGSVFNLKPPDEKKPTGMLYIDGTVRIQKGLIIAGLGGSMCYNYGLHQFKDFQMSLRILKLIPRLIFYRIFRGRFLDILVTHAPPEGIHDQPDLCHQGFRAFLWFMRRFKPRFLVHGHVHLYSQNADRVANYYRTKVVNAYNHTIIEINDHR